MTTTPAVRDLRVASSDRSHPERPALPGAVSTSGDTQPTGIWHGYLASSRRTLCGRPLVEMYVWPTLTWPAEAPEGAACYSCELVVEHQQ